MNINVLNEYGEFVVRWTLDDIVEYFDDESVRDDICITVRGLNKFQYKGLLPVSQFATDFSVLLNTLICPRWGSLLGSE